MPRLFKTLALALALLSPAGAGFAAIKIMWPTESTAFVRGESYEAFIQPTLGNAPSSGLFGAVRNGGYRFHEGIDIKPVRRSGRGEPLDDVYAAMAGTVMLVNDLPSASGYGRYVVIEHKNCDVALYTLYAHLSSIDSAVKPMAQVEAGQRLGQMGRSAEYKIAKEAAHLHFEIGLRYGGNFQRWYDTQKFGSKNRFGNFNGMNLQGMDPLEFMAAARAGKLKGGFANYILSQKTAFVARYYNPKTPDFALRYPRLADLNGSPCGWDIHFTWFGLPKKIERVKNPPKNFKSGGIELVYVDENEVLRKCRVFVKKDKSGGFEHTKLLKDTLQKMFF